MNAEYLLPQFQSLFFVVFAKNLLLFPKPSPIPSLILKFTTNSMEISVISDSISSIAYFTQSLGFSNILNRPCRGLSLSDTSSDQASQSSPPFHISGVSPPPTRTLTRRRLRRPRRVRRKIVVDYDGDLNSGDGYFVFGDGGGINNGDGYSGRGGGGKGWNSGGYGGDNREEYSNNSTPDPAFDFVYRVLCCIAMSDCLRFALKKVVKFASGFGDQEKIPMRFTPIC